MQGPAPWKVSGEAKFTLLLIPVEVSFSKSWGKDAPALPDKLVDVMPLLLDEWENDLNWTSDSGGTVDGTLVTLFDFEKEVLVEFDELEELDDLEEVEETGEKEKKVKKKMIIAPEASIIFNQSAIPMYTPGMMECMEICNDAVPSDYDSISISKVNKYEMKEPLRYEKNDFAPSLYRNLGIEEKLKIESYQKYNSGFRYDVNSLENFSKSSSQVIRDAYEEWKPLNSTNSAGTGKPADTSVYGSQPVNNRKDKATFERYYYGALYSKTAKKDK